MNVWNRTQRATAAALTDTRTGMSWALGRTAADKQTTQFGQERRGRMADSCS